MCGKVLTAPCFLQDIMPDIKSSWKFALEPILKEDKMDYEDNTTSVDQQAEPLEDIRSVKIQRNVVQVNFGFSYVEHRVYF